MEHGKSKINWAWEKNVVYGLHVSGKNRIWVLLNEAIIIQENNSGNDSECY